MDDQSLPTSDSQSLVTDSDSLSTGELEDSGADFKYVVRLSPYDKYTYEQVVQWLEEEFTFFVIGEELLPIQHFHIVVEDPRHIDDIRLLIRAFLLTYWGLPSGIHVKFPRGFGSKQFNLQLADEHPNDEMTNRSISYALKDKIRHHFKGYDPEYIQKCIDESFEKKDVSNFKIELQALKDVFQEDNSLDITDFMVAFMVLKAKYDQMVLPQHAYGTALSALIRREGPDAAQLVADNYIDKL